jgi:hypothetical protein
MFEEKFLMIVFYIPIAGVLLYTIFYPGESAILGKRWQFKQDNLEPSEDIIKYNRTAGIIALIIITVMFAFMIFR